MTKDSKKSHVGPRDATGLLRLPNVTLYVILRAMHGKDVAALLTALPVSTLPPELVTLRGFGATVSLNKHWPVVHIAKIPLEYTRLTIAALPAFAGVYVDARLSALAWVGATPPPSMPVTLAVDAVVYGALFAFAYVWGDRITNVIVEDHQMLPGPIADMLARCMNVESVTIDNYESKEIVAAYLVELPTQHLSTLKVHTYSPGVLDATAIVGWLQGPTASSLSLLGPVCDPMALANAIRACPTLASLTLDHVSHLHDALKAVEPNKAQSITSLSIEHDASQYGIDPLVMLDVATVRSFTLRNSHHIPCRLDDVLSVLAASPVLEAVWLTGWMLPSFASAGVSQHLSSITLQDVEFEDLASVPKIIQWLSTSRCLRTVRFYHLKLGKDGVSELARALPAWMVRGLETLTLCSTGLTDDDVVIFAAALASTRNYRSLMVDVSSNQLTMASASLLLTTLGACRNVTLRLRHACNVTGGYDSLDDIQQLVRVHRLQYRASGIYLSPPHTSSP